MDEALPVRERSRSFATIDTDIPFAEVSHRAGRAWRWLPQPEVEIAAVTDSEQWGAGIYLSRGEQVLATWSERPWEPLPGWVPLLLVMPDGEPFTVGNTIAFPALGSSEHGCDPETWVFVSFRPLGDGAVSALIEIEGSPYLALPVGGLITSLNGQPEQRELPMGGLALELASVSQLGLDLPWGPLSMTAAEPVPWLQLQGHDDFVEVGVDRSCEQAGVERVHVAWEVVL